MPYVIVLMLLLSSCQDPTPWRLHDVSGHLPKLQFSLLSDAGQLLNEQVFQGSVVLLFFGYTLCASECPVNLYRLGQAVAKLGDRAQQVRIVLVTLDPDYDSPEVLHKYLQGFTSGHSVALTGSKENIQTLVKRYRAAFRPGVSTSAMSHSAGIYVFDGTGRARLLIAPDDTIDNIVGDLTRLLALANNGG